MPFCVIFSQWHNVYEFDAFSSKGGVTDDDLSATLKDQVIGEVRTSAFLVAPYDAPLYRRFNSLKATKVMQLIH